MEGTRFIRIQHVSCVKGDICREVIEDPALEDMWEAVGLDKGHQLVALTVNGKTDEEVYKTLTKAAIKKYVGLKATKYSTPSQVVTLVMPFLKLSLEPL